MVLNPLHGVESPVKAEVFEVFNKSNPLHGVERVLLACQRGLWWVELCFNVAGFKCLEVLGCLLGGLGLVG